MKRTKIICTVGPACDNEQTLTEMALAGMNVARCNMSHGTHEAHKLTMDRIKAVREKLGLPIAIMLDTKGPEYRVGTFSKGKAALADGATFSFTSETVVGDATRVSVSYPQMIDELDVGAQISVNNGLLRFTVVEKTKTSLNCRVDCGGVISDRKSMSFPGKVFSRPYLSDHDKADLLFAIEQEVDFIACSFVSTPDNLLDIRRFLHEHGSDDIDLIAKIENQSGVDNIKAIIAESDGIMIARGDMGVEIPYEELPAIQKYLLKTCRMIGKRAITATEMLESMTTNPRPTRAEISDVANAVYDGTSALMLSGETAAGKYPVEAVRTMSRIAETTENNIDYAKRFKNTDFIIHNPMDALSHATCGVAVDLNVAAIVVCTRSGRTARMVSRFRSPIRIVGMTTDKRVWMKLSLSWAVTPWLSEEFRSTDVLFYHAAAAAKQAMQLHSGDTIVITGGSSSNESGSTDLIKLETLR